MRATPLKWLLISLFVVSFVGPAMGAGPCCIDLAGMWECEQCGDGICEFHDACHWQDRNRQDNHGKKWFRQNDARRLRQELRRDADAGPSSAGVVPRCLAEE